MSSDGGRAPSLSFRARPELVDALEAKADRLDCSLSELLRRGAEFSVASDAIDRMESTNENDHYHASPDDRARPKGANVGRDWDRAARENETKWGIQHPEELLSSIGEEVGEIEQAYFEATHEGGDPLAVQREIDDLGPLLMQLVESVRTHPMAFEPLPTAAECDRDD